MRNLKNSPFMFFIRFLFSCFAPSETRGFSPRPFSG
jgi:hypothetical protein